MGRTYLALAFIPIWAVLCGFVGVKLFGWLFGRAA